LIVTTAVFLLCVLLGAFAAVLVNVSGFSKQTSSGGVEIFNSSASLLLGALIGLLLGVAVAFQVWRLSGRRGGRD
jgi:cytosine/uracil/thiamine/allantoin permease